MTTCPNGHDVRDGAVFCGVCGIDLRIACVNGHPNAPGARFCEKCGAPVTDGAAPTSDDEGTALLSTPEFVEYEPEESPASIVRAEEQDPPFTHAADPPPMVASSMATEIATPPTPQRRPPEPSVEPAYFEPQFREPMPDGSQDEPRRSKKPLLIGICALVVVVIGAAVAFGLSNHHPPSANKVTKRSHHPGHSSPLKWSALDLIDPAGHLSSVSCASNSFCAAVDDSGDAVMYNGQTWTSPQDIDGGEVLRSVSCPTISFCVAVDELGNALTYQDDAWSGPLSIDSNGSPLSVSCTSDSFCEMSDGSGDVVTFDGDSWSGFQDIDSNQGIESVSCATTTSCGAVDDENGLSYDGETWVVSSMIDSIGILNAISCASSSFCEAVDGDGRALTYNGDTWSTGTSTGSDQLNSISCPTSSFCVAVNKSGGQVSFNGKSWSSVSSIDPNEWLTSISCPSNTFCASVDTAGNVVLGSIFGFSTATTTTTLSNETATDQASLLSTMLISGGHDRARVQNSIDVVQAAVRNRAGCTAGVATAVTTLNEAETDRASLLSQLASTQLTMVPRATLVRSELRRAWLMSLRIDKGFAQWSSVELNSNCGVSDDSVPGWVTAQRLDPESTIIKTTFVNLWNPIASQLGQPSHLSWFQI